MAVRSFAKPVPADDCGLAERGRFFFFFSVMGQLPRANVECFFWRTRRTGNMIISPFRPALREIAVRPEPWRAPVIYGPPHAP